MFNSENIKLVVAFFTFLGAFFAWLQGHKNSKKIQELHIIVNDRLTQLLAETKSSAHAQGMIEGKNQAGSIAEAKAEGLLEIAAEKARVLIEENPVDIHVTIKDVNLRT